MAISDQGKNQLYVSNYDTNEINIFGVNPITGLLELKDISLARIGPRSFAFIEGELPVKRTSSYAISLNAKVKKLIVSRIDSATGDLRKIGSEKTQADPVAAVIDQVHAKIYVANAEQKRDGQDQSNIRPWGTRRPGLF